MWRITTGLKPTCVVCIGLDWILSVLYTHTFIHPHTYWHFSNIYRYYWRLTQYTSCTDVTEIILPTLTCFVLYNHQISMCVLARKWGLKFILWKVSPNEQVWESWLEEGRALWLSSFVPAWAPSLQRTTGSWGLPRTPQSRFSASLEGRLSESSAIVKFRQEKTCLPFEYLSPALAALTQCVLFFLKIPQAGVESEQVSVRWPSGLPGRTPWPSQRDSKWQGTVPSANEFLLQ